MWVDSGLRTTEVVERLVMDSKDQSKFHSLRFGGPNINPTRLCLKPEACWLSLVNKCGVHIHVSHPLSGNVIPYQTNFTICDWVIVCGPYRWWYVWGCAESMVKSLTSLYNLKSELFYVKDFISCVCTIQDITSFHWVLCYFKVTVDVNIWILIHIFCRKCSNASLN